VNGVSFSPDSRLVASAGDDQTVRIWSAGSQTPAHVLLGHDGPVASVAFSADGRQVVSVGHDRTVRFWDTKSGKEDQERRVQGAPGYDLALSRDGRRVASTGAFDRVWDAANGREIFVGQHSIGWCATFSPDGSQVAFGYGSGEVRVWDTDSGSERLALGGNQGIVFGVTFTPDGRRIISGGGDGTVRFWDAESGREIIVFQTRTYVRDVVVSADGLHLAAAGANGTVWLWDALKDIPAELPRIQRPRTIENSPARGRPAG
jgi:WD40 repeat protein